MARSFTVSVLRGCFHSRKKAIWSCTGCKAATSSRPLLAGACVSQFVATYLVTNFIRHLTNFRQSVLGCIEASDSESRRIFQHFRRSTRCAFLCTTRNSTFCKNRLLFLQILLFITVKPEFMTNILTNVDEI